jgi:hypothetical protein
LGFFGDDELLQVGFEDTSCTDALVVTIDSEVSYSENKLAKVYLVTLSSMLSQAPMDLKFLPEESLPELQNVPTQTA